MFGTNPTVGAGNGIGGIMGGIGGKQPIMAKQGT